MSSIISPFLLPVRYCNSPDQLRDAALGGNASVYTGFSDTKLHDDYVQGAPSHRPPQPSLPWTPIAPPRSSSRSSTPTHGTSTPQGYHLSARAEYESNMNSIHDTDSNTNSHTSVSSRDVPLVQLPNLFNSHAGLPKLPLSGVHMDAYEFSNKLERWKGMERY